MVSEETLYLHGSFLAKGRANFEAGAGLAVVAAAPRSHSCHLGSRCRVPREGSSLRSLRRSENETSGPSRQKETKTFDFSDAAAVLDSFTLAPFFPRFPEHIKTLGLKQRLIYLQCHILALPDTRSLARFCLRGPTAMFRER